MLGEDSHSHSHLHFSTHWFLGSEVNYAMCELSDGSSVIVNCMCALERYHSHPDKSVRICELAGVSARCSRVLVKRRAKVGRTFDLVAGCGMTSKIKQDAFMRYRAASGVLVCVMAPICGPVGGSPFLTTGGKKILIMRQSLGSSAGK